jgi:hypothetical protein
MSLSIVAHQWTEVLADAYLLHDSNINIAVSCMSSQLGSCWLSTSSSCATIYIYACQANNNLCYQIYILYMKNRVVLHPLSPHHLKHQVALSLRC